MKVTIEETKVGFAPISVRQPQLHDLVDDPLKVCGIATGFEGRISARVRDDSGAEIAEASIRAGGALGTGAISKPRSISVALRHRPKAPLKFLIGAVQGAK